MLSIGISEIDNKYEILDKMGEPLAVMQVLNKRGGPFAAQDEHRLQAFSAQIAIALENARLFRDVLSLKNYNEGILRSLMAADADGERSRVALQRMREQDV